MIIPEEESFDLKEKGPSSGELESLKESDENSILEETTAAKL